MDKYFLHLWLGSGLCLILIVFASKTMSKFGLHLLLIFILIGMFTGPDATDGVAFNGTGFTQVLDTFAYSTGK